MKKWNNGWAVESLETGNYFIEESKKIGFIKSEFIDITKNTIKTSRYMYFAFFPAYIVDFLGMIFRFRTKQNHGNVIAAKYQYIGMKNNLWQYGIFIAKK